MNEIVLNKNRNGMRMLLLLLGGAVLGFVLFGCGISAGGMANDNMSAYAYANLLRHLGMEDKPIKVYDLFQMIPILDLDVINALGGDFVHAQRPRYRFNMDQKQWRPGTLNDGTPCLYPAEFEPIEEANGTKWVEMNGERYARMPKGGLYFDIMRRPVISGNTKNSRSECLCNIL